MTFTSIIKKNFTHNFKKYMSFYLVNVLIVAMLFIYGNLMYNSSISSEIKGSSIEYAMGMSLFGIVMFSIIFISYTNLSFLKSRGKEFGTYLTLGMTGKDLSRVVLLENICILVASVITGLISGILFSRLFYMVLNKILISSVVSYEITIKGILLSIGIFGIIFLCNIIFNMIYIKTVSISDVLKNSKNKEVGKNRAIMGIISLILFGVSIYVLPNVLLRKIFVGKSYMAGVAGCCIIVSTYMIIGSLIVLIKEILKKFPRVYNNNILMTSNLTHRFLAYKNIIYMVSILIGGAVFFIGTTYSLYVSSRDYMEMENPYDIMFIEDYRYNKVDKNEIENIINKNGSKLKTYKKVEYIEVKEFGEHDGKFVLRSDNASVMSETNYNKHMNTKYKLKNDESIYVSINEEKMKYEHKSAILVPNTSEKLEEELSKGGYEFTKEKGYEILKDTKTINIDEKNIKETTADFANINWNSESSVRDTLVVSDEIYSELKNLVSEDNIKNINLINMDTSDIAFDGIVEHLRVKNGFDDSYWKNGSLWNDYSDEEKVKKEAYRPTYIEELITLRLEENGINFFTMSFIGILFVVSNGVVLYYKIINDIDEERERVVALNRIGITDKEIRSNISKELAVVFIAPIIIGGFLGTYFIWVMYSNMLVSIIKSIMKSCLVVVGIIGIGQFIFYLIGRKKCFYELIKNKRVS